jgi:uncharacterized protein (DUF4415 family)
MQTKSVRVCDMTGAEGADTAAFGVLGVDYEIDLTPRGETAFDKALRQFITGQGGRVVRRSGKAKIRVATGKKNGRVTKTTAKRVKASANGGPSAGEVRKWAETADLPPGVRVSVRGRLGKDVMDAFRAAHAAAE